MHVQHTDRSEPPRLRLRNISVRFGGLTALDSVDLEVAPGRAAGVIGPNGAGKTTLFNTVCGLVRASSGTLELDGAAFTPVPHRLAPLGVSRTLQALGLFEGLTVLENVTAALRPAGTGFLRDLLALPGGARAEKAARERAMQELESLGIASHASALPATLPYGVRKKAALARALATDPRLLLLDEPAGGLGRDDIDELADLIRAIPGRGCSVVLVEHHVDLVMAVCDRITVLDFGRVIADGTAAAVREDPAVTDAYLGAGAA
ncbi:Lipopolysaccharide export system ATP-binding protein LptB [Arthrobacter saudimassiliensis]|uniref:Lipopolysaccharide export system ATP-binding protein LptB n=1 Tax=Arthrobacter saudimassiliensis TaxID=1461584 RepID=A0A078MMT5_9MICC|nr:Lipopolysaccharide export system ATP-binding protein LptB [Arthrobacter saudimassiliensis]